MSFGRKRGAQAGNQNARKHGFYSAALSAKARKILRAAQELDPRDIAHEIDLLRTHINLLVNREPGNVALLIMALKPLTRMIALHYRLDEQHADDIHHSLRDLVTSLLPPPKDAAP